MLIETDVLYAYVKPRDWLKPVAMKLMEKIEKGEFGEVYVSREALHELYYVSMEEGISLNEFIKRIVAVTAIDNLVFVETTCEIDLLAFTIMHQYKVHSVFDAYYAATALNVDPDHTIISTDSIFDRIPGLIRKDPRKIV
ncbi:MAG: type II toxin-antitoxin system VapC family toxin [Thermoproteales archaeon]|mgnify:CR=1 FL=1|nr:type II toxin-antitoxin system VapC family toxin [Thermoproteales archaeon]RLE66015.1 MAG: VapC toxin family PIN domain ribonuclease [Thermoprotei archaeon]